MGQQQSTSQTLAQHWTPIRKTFVFSRQSTWCNATNVACLAAVVITNSKLSKSSWEDDAKLLSGPTWRNDGWQAVSLTLAGYCAVANRTMLDVRIAWRNHRRQPRFCDVANRTLMGVRSAWGNHWRKSKYCVEANRPLMGVRSTWRNHGRQSRYMLWLTGHWWVLNQHGEITGESPSTVLWLTGHWWVLGQRGEITGDSPGTCCG